MSKYEDTRIVTFKEDYGVDKTDKDGKPTGQRDIYYKKNSKHAIHYKVVAKLEKRGAKMDVEEFDRKGYVKREKEKRLKRQDPINIERR